MGEDGGYDDGHYNALWNSLLECIADLKTRIDDLQRERSELLSTRSSKRTGSSSRSTKSGASNISKSSSKHAAVEAVKLREKMKSLRKRQDIDRRRDELERQQRELRRLDEEEELLGELNAAEAIKGLLNGETEDEKLPKKDENIDITHIQDPWDFTQLSQMTPKRVISGNPSVTKVVTPPTGTSPIKCPMYTGNPTDDKRTEIPTADNNTGNSFEDKNTGIPTADTNTGNPIEDKNTGVPPVDNNTENPEGITDKRKEAQRATSFTVKQQTHETANRIGISAKVMPTAENSQTQ